MHWGIFVNVWVMLPCLHLQFSEAAVLPVFVIAIKCVAKRGCAGKRHVQSLIFCVSSALSSGIKSGFMLAMYAPILEPSSTCV